MKALNAPENLMSVRVHQRARDIDRLVIMQG